MTDSLQWMALELLRMAIYGTVGALLMAIVAGANCGGDDEY